MGAQGARSVRFMSDLTPLGADEFAALSEQVRQHNSKKIYDLIEQLEPAALGFAGPINPGVVRAYLEALKSLGQLWRVYDKPKEEVVEEEVKPEIAAEKARMEVLKMLGTLADKQSGSQAG